MPDKNRDIFAVNQPPAMRIDAATARKQYKSALGLTDEQWDSIGARDMIRKLGDIKDARDAAGAYYESDGYKQRAINSGLTPDNPLNKTFSIAPKPNLKVEESVFDRSGSGRAVIGIKDRSFSDNGAYMDIFGTTLHEIGHANENYVRLVRRNPETGEITKEYRNVPKESAEILGRFSKGVKQDGHNNTIHEAYSDLLQLRGMLQKSGIFNSNDPDEVFDKEKLKEFKKKYKGILPRFLTTHDDETTVEAINKVAFQDVVPDNPDMQYKRLEMFGIV